MVGTCRAKSRGNTQNVSKSFGVILTVEVLRLLCNDTHECKTVSRAKWTAGAYYKIYCDSLCSIQA